MRVEAGIAERGGHPLDEHLGHRVLQPLRFVVHRVPGIAEKLDQVGFDEAVPAQLDVHVVLDNSSTHKTAEVKAWLDKRPRFQLHFTPTSASWMNLVERFFAEITRNRIRRGVFTSVADLKSAIMDYLDHHNADPKPFIWTKSAGEILEKVARAKQALESVH